MFNSKRCFKASTQNCNIEALKLASTTRMPKLHSERARTPVVLRSSDGFPVLSKWEIKLESCITPMVNYSPLSKTQNRHGRRWF
ncbi:hypothetical protein FS559_09695 [Treponema phagedenis]|nr:hypothetical protein FS559_09695 [Treponema phagedenis]